jgi:hypothetical protein
MATMSPKVDLTALVEEEYISPGFTWVITGPGQRRAIRSIEEHQQLREAREAKEGTPEDRERATAIQWARERHPQIVKLNAAAVRNGWGPTTECPPECCICHPEVLAPEANEKGDLSILDLRTGIRIPIKHKRGRCKVCGIRCPKIRTYCSDICRVTKGKPAAPPPLLCGFCRNPLTGAQKRWCSESCRKKAQRCNRRNR